MPEELDGGAARRKAAMSRRSFVLGSAAALLQAPTFAIASLPPEDRPDAKLLDRDVDILQSAYQ